MEQIINFFEQYWGYTLFGTVTVGALVTFIVAAVKLLISYADKNGKIKSFLDNTKVLTDQFAEEKKVLDTKYNELKQQYEVSKQESSARDNYYQGVIQAMFESVSYLAMSSKMDTKDKMALYDRMKSLTTQGFEQAKLTVTQVGEVVKEQAEKIDEYVAKANEKLEETKEQTNETLDKAKSLLEQYTEV